MGNSQGKYEPKSTTRTPTIPLIVEPGDEKKKKHVAFGELPFDKYSYPFENAVFEGGGNKGLAYCGAVRVLEDVGIWPQIRRLGGASAGGIVACLLCVGYTSRDIEAFLSENMKDLFLDRTAQMDHRCGLFSFLPNLICHYGWNPGKRIYEWIGDKIKKKTENADSTFLDIYKKFGRELCIVVTNVNRKCTEYLHVKTTPHMPVRLAVRMSLSIPGVFQAIQHKYSYHADYFVDGGVLCNYPVHCYDGWYLSMKREDSFIKRLHPLAELAKLYDKSSRFGEFNEKTLGLIVFSETEVDVMRVHVEERDGKQLPSPVEVWETPLAKARIAALKQRQELGAKHDATMVAVDHFLQVLKDNDLDKNDRFSKKEVERALSKEQLFTAEDFNILFGESATLDDVFRELDKDNSHDPYVTYPELEQFLVSKGVRLQDLFLDHIRQNVAHLGDFANCLQEALWYNSLLTTTNTRDIERTIGINTYYVECLDFDLETDDKKLLIQQGMRAAKAFLLYYIGQKRPPLRHEPRTPRNADQLQGQPGQRQPFNEDDFDDEIIDTRDYMDSVMERYNE